MDTAQGESKILTSRSWNTIEQRARGSRIFSHRPTGLHDRDITIAKPPRRAQGAGKILRADTLIHSRPMVLGTQDIVESIDHLRFSAFRQFLQPPDGSNLTAG